MKNRLSLPKIALSAEESGVELSLNFKIICFFFLIVLLTGGSARPEVESLVFLRPVAILMAAFGLVRLRYEHVLAHRFLFLGMAALLALTLFYLIPLPHWLWSTLESRQIIVDIDLGASLGAVWRPLSMAPDLGWNAFFSLFIPLVVLVYAAQLSQPEMRQLVIVLIVGGAGSAFIAVVQLSGSPDSPIYLYRTTNLGAAVGFFANRNHQALFLAAMLPSLAAYAAPRGRSRGADRWRLFVCVALTLFIFPLLLVTGSRAGLIVGALGVMAMPLIYGCGVRIKGSSYMHLRLVGISAVLGLVALIGCWVIFSGRAESITRLVDSSPGQELRYEKWEAVWAVLGSFMPFGSGPGTYEPVFQVIEPSRLLASSYSNHAHNDWLEVLFTTGVAGAAFLAISVVVFLVALVRQAARPSGYVNAPFGWAGLTILAMVAIASSVDYPLRTPIGMACFVIACLWVELGHITSVDRRGADVRGVFKGI